MAVLWQIGSGRAKKRFALLVCMLMVVAPAASENENAGKETGTESFAEVIPADVWLVNDSLKALAEPIQSNTFLVSDDDGRVQAWRKKSDAALWSFSSGPPLTSFRWFAKTFDDDGEDEEWNVDELRLKIDGSLSVYSPVNGTKSLKITLEDLRQGSVYVRGGEIIQVDRHTTIFLVDIDSGAIMQELWNGNTEDLNLDQERNSIFLIRTDYIAKASNLSGSSLWSLSYGEIGTLVTGLESPTKVTPSLSLLPKMSSAPGVPYKIAPPMNLPAAIVGKSSRSTNSLPPAQNRALEPLHLPAGPGPASLPLPKPAPSLAIWEPLDSSGMPNIHAPGMTAPPKPTPKIVTVYKAGVGVVLFMIFGAIFKIYVGTMAQPAPPAPPLKKKKARKLSTSGKEILTDTAPESETEEPRVKSKAKNGEGTQVGRLFVTNILIGSGSNGTLVLEGYLDDRKVAVKRLLAQYYEKAQKEIALLIASDEHPNVVRYYATEETSDFVYVSLERCSFSLYDLILAQTAQGPGIEKQVKECLAGKGLKLRSVEDFRLWDERGRPSPQLFQVMRDVVAGLAHLHAVGIVHRDLKPHNVLISSGRIMQAKIADMGLSKQLDDDAVSFDTLTGHGSAGSRGWQAPEQLLKGRGSRAVDIFSLGCVLYHCITGGKHPFGSHLERDGNIAYGKMDLFHIIDFPEATDLIESLLDSDPAKRPPAHHILVHPFFWDAEKRMSFLKDASDRVELDIKDCNSILYADIESLELSVLCGGWDSKLDFALLQNIRGYRRYNYKSVRDLLRVIRNKSNHYRELPEELQAALGTVPDGIDEYFASRFPRLLTEVYHVIGYHCREDPSFEKYYPASYVPKFPPEEAN